MRQDSLGISNPGVARDQQRAGSRFLRKLNARDDTPGGGSFTQIATDDDEIVPYTRCFPKSQRRTENITFQDHNAGLPITARTSTTLRSPGSSSSARWATPAREPGTRLRLGD